MLFIRAKLISSLDIFTEFIFKEKIVKHLIRSYLYFCIWAFWAPSFATDLVENLSLDPLPTPKSPVQKKSPQIRKILREEQSLTSIEAEYFNEQELFKSRNDSKESCLDESPKGKEEEID